jgi:hypothetical protein
MKASVSHGNFLSTARTRNFSSNGVFHGVDASRHVPGRNSRHKPRGSRWTDPCCAKNAGGHTTQAMHGLDRLAILKCGQVLDLRGRSSADQHQAWNFCAPCRRVVLAPGQLGNVVADVAQLTTTGRAMVWSKARTSRCPGISPNRSHAPKSFLGPKHRRMPVLASWPFEVSWDIDDVKRTWAIVNINNVRRSRDLRLNEDSSDPSACY